MSEEKKLEEQKVEPKEETASKPEDSEKKTNKSAEPKDKGKDEKKGKEKPTAKKKKSKRRAVVEGCIHILASYNNTLVSITEPNGEVISWSSAGSSGFKGARKATPYAAQVATENAIQKAKIYGLEREHVFMKGAGNGREQAMRGITANQIEILSITDTTALPHNGCRKKKHRRV